MLLIYRELNIKLTYQCFNILYIIQVSLYSARLCRFARRSIATSIFILFPALLIFGEHINRQRRHEDPQPERGLE